MPILTNQSNATYNSGAQAYTAISNNTTLNLLNPSLTLTKSQNVSNGVSGDTVTFTIVCANTDIALALTNVVVLDNLTAAGYTFMPGSCKINGVTTSDNPQTGVNVATILLLSSKTVTFNATIN